VKRRHLSLILILVLIGLAIGLGAARTLGPRLMGQATGAAAPDKGQLAPDFTAQTLDGRPVRLSDYRGQPVVLNFFAGWCGPCKVEAPHLQAAYETGAGSFVLLGVTFQDTQATAQEFVRQYGLTFPVLLDPTEKVGQTYRIRSFPVTFFIRPDGVIFSVIKGPMTREFILVMLEQMAGA